MASRIEVHDVCKNQRVKGLEFQALKNVNFEVPENDFLVIIGPSGCGKSTLLSMIAGLTSPTSGEILIDGTPVRAPNPQKVALMFQDHLLLPWRNVKKNISFGLEPQKLPPEIVEERVQKYLKLVGLDGFGDAYPHQLSGGMKQRVALCRALAMETEILLMDEPFGALDEQTRLSLADELGGIWIRVRKTIVFVTHSISEAIYLGERIVVFSPRPGTVRRIVRVDSPRPRELTSPSAASVYKVLSEDLKNRSAAN